MKTNVNQQGTIFSRSFVRLLLACWGICVLYPMIWTFYTSFKDNKQLYASAWALPKQWLVENYVNAWVKSEISANFANSLFVTILATFLSLLLAATTSYVIARYVFKGRVLLYFLYVSAMMIPGILGLIPLFFLMMNLNLLNSLMGISIIYAVTNIPFGVFILTTFYKALPKELEEAAAIDGCGYYRTFFKVMLPLSRSGLITVGIMNVLAFWNEYFMGLVFLQDKNKYTLPVGIAYLAQEAAYRTDWGALFAGLVISMVPLIIIYAIFQKRITEGLTAGAIKG